MIKELPTKSADNWLSRLKGPGAGTTSSWSAQARAADSAASQGPQDASNISGEASETGHSSPLNPLLQGLQSWAGAPESGASPVGQGQDVKGQGQAPSQVPIGIINQVFNTMKTAGGMATVGALQSLLSWGASEKEKSGKIRPEFQEILREAISFAKENRIMSPEDLAKFEARLFGGKGGEQGGAGEGGKSAKGKPSIKESLQAVAAA